MDHSHCLPCDYPILSFVNLLVRVVMVFLLIVKGSSCVENNVFKCQHFLQMSTPNFPFALYSCFDCIYGTFFSSNFYIVKYVHVYFCASPFSK